MTHDVRFLVGQHAGIDVVDTGLSGDPPSRALVVTGEQDGSHSNLAQCGDGAGRIIPQLVAERDHTKGVPVLSDRDDGPARGLEFVYTWSERCKADAFAFEKIWLPYHHVGPVNASRHTAPWERREVFNPWDSHVAIACCIDHHLRQGMLGGSFGGSRHSEQCFFCRF